MVVIVRLERVIGSIRLKKVLRAWHKEWFLATLEHSW